MPQACTRIRTCPAPGLGISRSTISKSAPGFGTCTTFILAIETLPSLFWIRVQNLDAPPLKTDTSRGAADARSWKKFCNDFRSDAQALRLTPAVLPRTMRHRLNKKVLVPGIIISALALPRGTWYKSEEKANTKQTSHAC